MCDVNCSSAIISHYLLVLSKDIKSIVIVLYCKAAARAALPSPTSACSVFSCFHNPPNTDMDHRIFNMRMWSFVCMRKHTEVGQTDSKSAQHFRLRKTLTNFSGAPDGAGVWTPLFGSRVQCSTNRPTHSAPDLSIKHRTKPIIRAY